MDRNGWKKRIKKASKAAGTYQPFFDHVIDTLAQILEERDKVREQYESSGGHPTIIHVNKAKEKNAVKNPMLVMEMDLNAQALAYWRDLGLTPAGLKKLNAEVVKDRQAGGNLEQILEGLAADG